MPEPKITVHRERRPVAPGGRHYAVYHHVSIEGGLFSAEQAFATISSVGGLTSSWRVQIYDPPVWSGDFYGYPEARAWALEMARRKVDPARGPIVSTKTPYGGEQTLEQS